MEEEEFADSLFESDLYDVYDSMLPDIVLLEEGGKAFVWERAFESITEKGKTQFWTIHSDEYQDNDY